MPTIEFIYDRDCPNVEGARAALRDALSPLKRTLVWQEWDRADRKAPAYVRAYGSPTILVDGKDIASMPPGDASACRVYRNERGNTRGIPDNQLILAAVQQTSGNGKRASGRMRALAMLPKLTCAACWPAYAALLSALGVEFVDYTPYLLPITVTALGVALFGLGWRAHARRGYAPLTVGVIASIVILVGKFGLDSDIAAYLGAVALISATVWNLWPTRRACCATTT